MAFKEYAKEEWSFLKKSFKIDRRFWLILLWEVLLILAMFAGLSVFSYQMNKLEPMMMQAASQLNPPFMLEQALVVQSSEQLIKAIQSKVITYTVLMIIFTLLVWPFFKSLTYLTLRKKKLTAKFYGKFVIAEILWTLLLVIVIFILQLIFYKTLFLSLPYSAAARATLLLGLVLAFVLLCYFTITFFITFTKFERFWETIKQYWKVPIKRIKHFLVPMLFTLLMFIVLNIMIRLLQFLPRPIAALLSTVVVLGYIAWLKIYYNECIDRKAKEVKPKKAKPKPRKKIRAGKKKVVKKKQPKKKR